MDYRWGGTHGTVVPAFRAARSTVMGWRLEIFFLGHTGRTGTGPCDGSFSGSFPAAGSVVPSTDARVGVVYL